MHSTPNHSLLFFFITLLMLGSGQPVWAQKTPIKIAIVEAVAPYSFIDSEGLAQGMLVDYWRLWSTRTGQDIKFVPFNLKHSVNALSHGKVDLHAGISYTNHRANTIEYLPKIFANKGYLYVNKQLADSLNLPIEQALKSQPVGVIEGSSYDQFFQDYYPQISLKRFATAPKMTEAITHNLISAFANDSAISSLQLIHSLKYNQFIKVKFDYPGNAFYAAITPNNVALRSIVEAGMNKISAPELAVLEKKWFDHSAFRLTSDIKGMAGISSKGLNAEELHWLKGQREIVIAVASNWFKLSFVDRSGQPTGYNLDLINMINQNLDINLVPKFYDTWYQGFQAFERGDTAGVMSLSRSTEREKTIAYSPVYLYSPHHIVVRHKNHKIKDMASLNGARVSLFENHLLHQVLVERLPNLRPVFIDSNRQGIEQVRDGNSDAVLLFSPDLKALHSMGLEVSGQVYSKASEYAVGTRKDNPILSSIIAKGIGSITAVQRKKLYEKWRNPSLTNTSLFTTPEREYISNNRRIRVGTIPWKPLVTVESGKLSGIVGDLLREVTALSGLEFDVEQDHWSNVFDGFKQQDIDLIPIAFRSKDREEFALFGDAYFNLALSIYVRDDDSHINGFSQLNGKRVAILTDSSKNEIIAKRYPNIIIVNGQRIEDLLVLLLNNQVDAVLGNSVVVNQVIVDGLYQGIKQLAQTQIKPRTLHFMSQQNQPLLHSILNKSLRAISKQRQAGIIEKWIGAPKDKSAVKVAFGSGRPPYVIRHQNIKGIEFDLVKRILSLSNIDISAAKNLSLQEMENVLGNDPDLDLLVSVKRKQDHLFYSDDFVTFNNVVITRKVDGIIINEISDLAGKSISAFEGAHKYLGDEYAELHRSKSFDANYQELDLQAQQVEGFITGKADVLIMGVNIFRFLARKYGYATLDSFSINDQLFAKNSVQVAFKSQSLRDTFNRNLHTLKQSGEYQQIVDNYVNGMSVEKYELTSLIANVLANEIYTDNLAEISSIGDLFSSLEHIVKIEVFNKNNRLLFSSSDNHFSYFTRHESMHWISGQNQRVGYVQVYFDDNKLSQKIDEHNYIPPVNLFKSLIRYSSIKDIYQRYGYSNRKIDFTPLEKHYIGTRGPINFSEVLWEPLSINTGGQYQGLVADYLALISQKSGLEFSYQYHTSWDKVVSDFNRHKLDMLPSVSYDASGDSTNASLSKPYASFSFAMVMNEQGQYVNTIEELSEATFALPKGYSSHDYIKSHFPNFKIMTAQSPEQALEFVRSGKADVFVGHLAVVSNQLNNSFPDLRVVGLLDHHYLHKMMLHGEDEILLAIINKSIDSISVEQHQEIEKRWMHHKVSTAVDYTIVYQIIAVFTLSTLLILAFLRRLSSAKKQLERSIDELKQTQEHLVESEKMAGLGSLVAGVAHEINTPVGIGLTAVSHFVAITGTLKQDYDNNRISKNNLEKYLKDAGEVSHIIHRNLERTAELVSSFKQISVDQSSDEVRTFNVAEYINEILVSISHITKRSQANISLDCDPQLKIESSPGAFSQILSNLVINSTIHGYPNNESGKIEISISAVKGVINLVYQDDGAGISDEHLSKIFEPFFTTNREYGGSGLGLNIIYNIVKNRLHGTIKCTSKKGQGVRFNITFPLRNSKP